MGLLVSVKCKCRLRDVEGENILSTELESALYLVISGVNVKQREDCKQVSRNSL